MSDRRVVIYGGSSYVSEELIKIIPNDNSFIAVLTSVAGIRGRGKRLFYSSAKSGMNVYLSGLRQKIFDKKINVLTDKLIIIRIGTSKNLSLSLLESHRL